MLTARSIGSRRSIGSTAATPNIATARLAPLTSIRGLAAWWIVVYHFREYLPVDSGSKIFAVADKGFYAVDLFFILSGFVLYLNYHSLFHMFPAGEPLRRFAIARFARVYPLYLFMMLLFLLNPLAIALHSGHGFSSVGARYNPSDYVISLLLVQNWGFTDHLSWNIPSWSISTEFAAYIIFPPASYLTWRFIHDRGTCLLAVSMCLGALALVFWLLQAPSLGDNISELGLPRCLLQFLTGMMLSRLFQLHGAPASDIGLWLCGLVLFILGTVGRLPDYVFVPASFAIVVLALSSSTGLVVNLLSSRIFICLGEISYSTYLVHFFVKDWVKFVFVRDGIPEWTIFATYLALTLLASAVLYTLVEVPARTKLRALGERRRAAAIFPLSAN